MRRFSTALCLLVFSCICASGFSDEGPSIPSKPDGYVTDRAGIISQKTRLELESLLQAFEKSTTNQVVVATFQDLGGTTIEDFSIRLAETWKIGQKDRDNGVILLISKNDREVRIEVGYGLEGVLPDAVCHHIIQDKIVRAFRNQNYDDGIVSAVNAICDVIKGEYTADLVRKLELGQNESLWHAIAFLILIIIVLIKLEFWNYTIRFTSPGGFGYDFIQGYDSPGRGFRSFGRSFGGGGFRGGGGSFGGGGASGRW
jgi:uncharacterized protein